MKIAFQGYELLGRKNCKRFDEFNGQYERLVKLSPSPLNLFGIKPAVFVSADAETGVNYQVVVHGKDAKPYHAFDAFKKSVSTEVEQAANGYGPLARQARTVRRLMDEFQAAFQHMGYLRARINHPKLAKGA